MRVPLRTFLLIVAIAGPLAAYVLRPQLPLLQPRVTFSRSEIRLSQAAPPIQTIAVYEPGTQSRDLRFAIVRHSTGELLQTISPAWYCTPIKKGLSICRTEVFLDGQPVPIKQTPCILVLDYDTREFAEVPITSRLPPFIQAADLAALPEWKTDIAPRVNEMHAAFLKGGTNGRLVP